MRHNAPHEYFSELAALYALGSLTQQEVRAFEEHLAEGCEACRAELDDYQFVVAGIGLAAAEAEPARDVKDRLIAGIEEPRPAAKSRRPHRGATQEEFKSIRAGEGRWGRIGEGIQIKRLHVDELTGIATSLIRMAPGSKMPMHSHSGTEQFFVLEGDCNVNGEVLGPGDFHRASAGSVHGVTYTQEGTLLLLVAPKSYSFV